VDVRDGRSQVIVNGWKHIGGYDLRTGAELWKLVGGGDIPVPTPIVAGDLIFITNAHGRMAPIYAIEPMASGTISAEAPGPVRWMIERGGNYMQTPVVYGDHLYACTDSGILSRYAAATGEPGYRERLGEGRTGFTASLVAGDGKIFATSEEGDVHVVRAGPTFEMLAVNEMGETCMATPAIVGGTLYIRTRGHVVCISQESTE
jgi:outer membrane protein assembly factor BamB